MAGRKAQMGGQLPVDIFAETPDRFFLTIMDATLAFTPGRGHATAVTLSQGSHSTEFLRLP
jgi:D-alanyl-D-alanine carboxypeptidase